MEKNQKNNDCDKFLAISLEKLRDIVSLANTLDEGFLQLAKFCKQQKGMTIYDKIVVSAFCLYDLLRMGETEDEMLHWLVHLLETLHQIFSKNLDPRLRNINVLSLLQKISDESDAIYSKFHGYPIK